MQRPDEAKRRLILDSATRLFAARPFHEVRLEDVAAAASLGKGTLYIYFASKEELYLSLIREGFAEMVALARVEADGLGRSAWDRIAAVVRCLIAFAMKYPDLYRVMRSGVLTPEDPNLVRTRGELTTVIESTLREGNQRGEMNDPRPDLTAQFVLSFVRGALLYPPPDLSPESLEAHIMRVLRRGIGEAGGAAA